MNLSNISRVFLLATSILIGSVTLSSNAVAGAFGGIDVTPSEYNVTLKKIEFEKANGGFVTLASGSFPFDIAGAAPGADIGSFAVGSSLPADSYVNIRITIGKIFGITASIADAGMGQPCRTNTGNGLDGVVLGGLTNVADGTIDGAGATSQNVTLPTGAAVTAALGGAGITEVGGDLEITTPAVFTIDAANAVMPALQIDFDLTNAAELLTTSVGTCAVFPQPPGITFTLN